MPKGVEHIYCFSTCLDSIRAKGSVMPKGVEHSGSSPLPSRSKRRKDQGCRKALSTGRNVMLCKSHLSCEGIGDAEGR